MKDSDGYSKGSLLSSSKEWFHGELPQAEAERALMTSECNCFLIRQENKSLILSLRHQNSVHHVNIQYGPGWYKLENGSAQDNFAELDHLLAYYRENALSKTLDTKLGAMCEKSLTLSAASGTSGRDNTTSISTYASFTKPATPSADKSLFSSGNYNSLSGYQGTITKEEADAALSVGSGNVFMVREGPTGLVLSRRISGWKSHTTIHHDPAMGYRLEGRKKWFETVSELIMHYRYNSKKDVLGDPLDPICKWLRWYVALLYVLLFL